MGDEDGSRDIYSIRIYEAPEFEEVQMVRHGQIRDVEEDDSKSNWKGDIKIAEG